MPEAISRGVAVPADALELAKKRTEFLFRPNRALLSGYARPLRHAGASRHDRLQDAELSDNRMRMPWEISGGSVDAAQPQSKPARDTRYPPTHGKGISSKSRRARRQRKEQFDRQDGKCHWCGGRMEMEPPRCTQQGRVKDNPAFATWEHLWPKSMGGLRAKKHCVLAHGACNFKREKRRWPHDPVYGRKHHAVGQSSDVGRND